MKDYRSYIQNKTNYTCNFGGRYDVLTKKVADLIVENIDEEYHDFTTSIKNCMVVVEVATVDNEKDIHIYSMYDYCNKYGQDHLDDWLECGELSQELYDCIKSQL